MRDDVANYHAPERNLQPTSASLPSMTCRHAYSPRDHLIRPGQTALGKIGGGGGGGPEGLRSFDTRCYRAKIGDHQRRRDSLSGLPASPDDLHGWWGICPLRHRFRSFGQGSFSGSPFLRRTCLAGTYTPPCNCSTGVVFDSPRLGAMPIIISREQIPRARQIHRPSILLLFLLPTTHTVIKD
jgi:hypothetical protein